MLGWDVGYVWPLLEGVVATQVTDTHDTWDMGNPHEAATQTTPGATSSRNHSQGVQHSNAAVVPEVEPPPYESVASNQTTNYTPQHNVISRPYVNNNRSSNNESAGANRRHRTNTSSRNRNNNNNSSNQRFRPPKWPHKASSVFACLSCVIGLCNVSRFSILVYIYKGNFLCLKIFDSFV